MFRAMMTVALWVWASGAFALEGPSLADADAAFRAGQMAQARAAYQSCRIAAAEQGDPEAEARALIGLGQEALYGGRREDALRAFNQAILIAENAERDDLAATARAQSGLAYELSGAFPDALKALDLGAQTATDGELRVVALTNAARLARSLGQADVALARLDEARAAAHADPHVSPNALTALSLFVLETQLSGQGGARAYGLAYEAAKRAGAESDDRAVGFALWAASAAYQQEGRHDEAAALINAAIATAGDRDPYLAYRLYQRLGELERARGDVAAAQDAYAIAAEAIDSVRADLLSASFGAGPSFRESVGPVFTGLAEARITLAKAADGAEREALLRSARDAVERFKNVELQDYFGDACVARFAAERAEIEELGADAAAIYPVLLDDRTEVIVSTREGLTLHTAEVSRARLETEAYNFRRRLQSARGARHLSNAQRLYDVLIRPFEDALAEAEVRTLVVVPDGALRNIPIAALHDGERYVIQRFATVVSPSLELTPSRSREGRVEAAEALAAALSESVQGYVALPATREETQTLSQFTPTQPLLDKDFQSSALQRAFSEGGYRIVHLASHGEFGGAYDESFLLTYSDRIDINTLESFIQLRRNRDEPIDLLTLSACETAAGDDRAALGLAGVALKAGARSAIASLWRVADEAAAQFTGEFYRLHLAEGLSKAEAVRAAQLGVLADPRYAHPAFWSPFLLVGDWS